MSCNLIPVHGFEGLQSNFMAACVDDVPFTFLNVTWLTFTPELCINNKATSEYKKQNTTLVKQVIPLNRAWTHIAFYLMRATIIGAIVLVNDDGIPNVPHNKVSEHEIFGKAITWSCPRLYPNAILRLCENRICYCDIRNPRLIVAVSQTSNAASKDHSSRKLWSL